MTDPMNPIFPSPDEDFGAVDDMNTNDSELREEEPQECWNCIEMHFVSKNGLCGNCKNEIRSIDDCWLVQEFRKRYSEAETQEGIEQIRRTLLGDYRSVRDIKVALSRVPAEDTWAQQSYFDGVEAVKKAIRSSLNLDGETR